MSVYGRNVKTDTIECNVLLMFWFNKPLKKQIKRKKNNKFKQIKKHVHEFDLNL